MGGALGRGGWCSRSRWVVLQVEVGGAPGGGGWCSRWRWVVL